MAGWWIDLYGVARALVTTAQGAGCMTSALITDMTQPLATAAGNALEVAESVEVLAGGGPLMDLGVYVLQEALMASGEVPPVAITARELPKKVVKAEKSG